MKAKAHADDPEILLVNRADANERALSPFKFRAPLNFPKIDGKGGTYWVIFVDQNPCEPAPDPQNPSKPDPLNQKAYKGTPDDPPHCLIRLRPDDFRASTGRNLDLNFRYAVWVDKEHVADTDGPHVGPPAWILPYHSVPCHPECD